MPRIQVTLSKEARPDLDAWLSERIYAFNCLTTGVADGELLSATVEDEQGRVAAAVSGHTWGGVCEIVNLWVREDLRRQGLGSALLLAAEREAVARGCHQVVLSTHSFQAPRFYEKHGFHKVAVIPSYPRGHEKLIYLKRLKLEPPNS